MKTTVIGPMGTALSPDYPKQLFCIEWRTGTRQSWRWHRSPPLLPALTVTEYQRHAGAGHPVRSRLWAFQLLDEPLPATFEAPPGFFVPDVEFSLVWPGPEFEVRMP